MSIQNRVFKKIADFNFFKIDINPKKVNILDVFKESLKDVGGENFRYNIFIPNDNEANYGWGKVWDSKLGFKVSLLKFRIPKNPLENFYVSKENLISQENNFIFYKNEIDKNIEYLNEFKDCA